MYVFEDLKADNCCSNTFEWCSQGTASQKAQRQRLSYAEEEAGRGFDWFDEEGIFYCSDCTKQLSAYPKALIEPGVQAVLQCAVKENNQIIGVFLLKKQAQEESLRSR